MSLSKDIDRQFSLDNSIRIIYFDCKEADVLERVFAVPGVIPGIAENLLKKPALREVCERLPDDFNFTRYSELRYGRLKNAGLFRSLETVTERSLFGYSITGKEGPKAGIFTVSDFQRFATDSEGADIFSAFLNSSYYKNGSYLFVTGCGEHIPKGFSASTMYIKLKPADTEDIEYMRKSNPERFEGCEGIPSRSLAGFTGSQIREILEFAHSVSEDANREKRIEDFMKAVRRRQAENEGGIKFVDYDAAKEYASGCDAVKRWIFSRKSAFENPEMFSRLTGREKVDGVLFAGPPGVGKTETAKECARILGVPLVELRLADLRSKYVGESEERLRSYLSTIESVGECVLLVDEIDKSFSGEEGSESSRGVLQTLLNWLTSNKSRCLPFFAANHISKLPNALYRDGRVSGKFFVFLPSCRELAQILTEKLKGFDKDIGRMLGINYFLGENDDVAVENAVKLFDEIAREAKGFSGAEKYKFFTGANIVSLIEKTNIAISASTGAKNEATYREEFKRQALSSSPQGQCGLSDLIVTFLETYTLESSCSEALFSGYRPVGKDENPLRAFPKAVDDSIGEYDAWMLRCIAKELYMAQWSVDNATAEEMLGEVTDGTV